MSPACKLDFEETGNHAFTLPELLVVILTVAILAMVLLPAIAGTKPSSQSFQCLENERQLILAWQMYAQDNSDLLPPNDYPYETCYYTSASKASLRNWVVGTMEQAQDAATPNELLDPNSLLSAYLTNTAVYHCPADNYVNPNAHTLNARSYAMNSAVGTIWNSSITYGGSGQLGTPVPGGWLAGASYNANQTAWQTYGKMTSFTSPGPASTFVIMDENPFSINSGALAIAANATPGSTYLIAFPAGNHDGSACISFADGHVIVHRWLDSRTYVPTAGIIQPGQGGTAGTVQVPDNPDCFYLGSITSAHK